ncbi:MAG: hypothetical protein AAB583_02140 [Patescibacteria group bacterium]
MDDSGVFGNTLGQLGSIAKTTGQQIVKELQELAKEGKGQIVKHRWKSDEERIKFLRDLYGSSKKTLDSSGKNTNNTLQNNPHDEKPTEFERQIADKSPREQKELLELRRDLHKQVYYDPTFNPPQKQEERPAEKAESQKKQEMAELEKKEEKKPPPLAVQREQNKAEMFRGVSG